MTRHFKLGCLCCSVRMVRALLDRQLGLQLGLVGGARASHATN